MPETAAEQEKIKNDVLKRMKRIEGQIRGIQGMIESGKECGDILTQVKAARSALKSSSKLIMKRYMLKCYAEALENGEDPVQAMDKFVTVMTNYMD
ncbi:metal-sensitive transcriptional regulator [Desulfovibrio sp. JC022]|uniref:metal-sensitive transcriptional regulator n=1 Tax=Desulfovibrio sp. JC022 TaxID=2593642 RepID=UPI0013D56C63|nr:metal-sensitive transcriptional regulator [Desulfovibrio sp. JC022]NDV23387.1 metal-sensitive transcriptional regulator [Desulfovibrio sp. JC022]